MQKGSGGSSGKMAEERRELYGYGIMLLISKGTLNFVTGLYAPCSESYLQSWSIHLFPQFSGDG